MEPLIDARINDWIAKLDERFAQTGAQMDFAPWAVFVAYDIISEVGFGAPFGFIEQGTDVSGLIQGFHDGLVSVEPPVPGPGAEKRKKPLDGATRGRRVTDTLGPLQTPFGILARLYPFTNWMKSTFLGKYLVASPEQDSGIGTLMRFRDRLIKERLRAVADGATGGRTDLLQTFLDARDDKGEPLDMEYVRAEILLVLLAGADTTGTQLQAMMMYLMKNPRVYARLMEELDGATRRGELSEVSRPHTWISGGG